MLSYRLSILAVFTCTLALTVAQDLQPSGNWTEWSQWTNCSRTCGGGVTMQSRTCIQTSNETITTCEGESVKYQMCNIQDCPDDAIDYRMLQCSAYDKIPHKGKYYRWAGFEHNAGECELKCMPKGQFFYVTFSNKVADGTRCNSRSLDICVDGKCLPVGCDMQLHSGAEIDQGGLCNGDNSTCRLISRNFELAPDSYDYVDIVIIPAGATNIHIKEIGEPQNYIALTRNNQAVLNADHIFSVSITKKHDGSNMKYTRNDKINEVTIEGPLELPLQLKIYALRPDGANFSYEFYVPESYTGDQERKAEYIWVMDS